MMQRKFKSGVIMILLLVCCSTNLFGQQLREGDKAPALKALDVHSVPVSLASYKGKVLVAFMRYISCPVCNHRMHELMENYDKIKAGGYDIIVIYESSPEVLLEYLEETPVPFTVIGDPKRRLYKQFAVEPSFWKSLKSAFDKDTRRAMALGKKQFNNKEYKRDGKLTGIPADFIISEEGVIEIAYYGNNISDHLPLERILTDTYHDKEKGN